MDEAPGYCVAERPAARRTGQPGRRRQDRSAIRSLFHALPLSAAALCAGCEPVRDPPPTIFFIGLPVSGRLIDAQRAGFDDCFNMDAVHVRCRRHAIMVGAAGPYEGAVDLVGADGEGGFDQVTLWHKRDNYAVYKIAEAFEKAGWRYCYTGDDRRGDQMIYTRANAPVRVSMDMSYYAKRRIRLMPLWNLRERRCVPEAARPRAAASDPR